MFHKLLAALDTSELSQHIFDEAVSLAKTSNANLMLLHVLNPLDEQYIDPMFVQPTILYPEYQAQKNEIHIKDWTKLKQDRSNWLNSQCEQATKLGIVAEFNQYIGEASRTICDVARNYGADLIIMGRRGHRGLSEFFLGSVSNYVLHHTSCSVLIVQGSADITPVNITNEEFQREKLETESTI